MVREAKRVRADTDADVARVLEEVHADGEPRIVERNGEAMAAIVPVEEVIGPPIIRKRTREDTERAFELVGSWKGLVSEDFSEKLMKRRHESPPSPPVKMAISHLADSDLLIDYLQDRPRIVEFLRRHIDHESVGASIISYGELYEGILSEQSGQIERTSLLELFERIQVIGLDEETAREFGGIRSDLLAQGQLLADNDLWIAATALRSDLTLVSRDVHFDRVPGLKLLRPE